MISNLKKIKTVYLLVSLIVSIVSIFLYNSFTNTYRLNNALKVGNQLNDAIGNIKNQNYSLIKEVLDNKNSNIKLPQKSVFTLYYLNKDGNFLPKQSTATDIPEIILYTSDTFQKLVEKRFVDIFEIKNNTVIVKTFYRENDNLYSINTILDLSNFTIKGVSISAKPSHNNYIKLSNAELFVNANDSKISVISFATAMLILFLVGYYAILRYTSRIIETETDIKKKLSASGVDDIDNSLPDYIKSFINNISSEVKHYKKEEETYKNVLGHINPVAIFDANNMIFANKSFNLIFEADTLNEEEKGDLKTKLNSQKTISVENKTFFVKKIRQDNLEVFTLSEITEYEKEIKKYSDKLSEYSSKFESLSTTILELTSVTNELKSTMVNIASSLTEQSSSISEISSSSEEIRSVAAKLDETLEHINKNMDEISSFSFETTNKMSDFQEIVGKIHESAGTISKEIANLSDKLYAIAGFTDKVNNISTQTKILAINIAIEAAKSSESDNKFSIIASEVKSLADISSTLSEDITSAINDITNGINKTTMSTEEAIKNILKAKEGFDPIKRSSEKSAEAVLKVTQNVNDITQSFKDHRTGLDDITTTIKDISKTIQDITAASNDVKESIIEINRSITFLKETMNRS
ncbi:hypothetical protein DSN97_08665 [Deferribacteraceae bacterium V6Fe1]|nr:hypothetical protein DSN97_08665 [Deferribacteraceae bacterium V6Fe1]